MVRPLKSKRCLQSVRNLKESIQSEIDCLEKIYEVCLAKMKENDPNFLPPVSATTCCDKLANNNVSTCHKEVQVSIQDVILPDLLEEERIPPNTASVVIDPEISLSAETAADIRNSNNGHGVQNGHQASQNGLQSCSLSNGIDSKKRETTSAPQIIKIEDSSSEESNHSLERVKTEKVVHKMIGPSGSGGVGTQESHYSKTMLHYVVLENLPPQTTVDDVVNELFDDLLGIKSHEMTGITVHNLKTESYAQIYFQDFRHVQRILAFNGKLVFKGRVMTSRIGMA